MRLFTTLLLVMTLNGCAPYTEHYKPDAAGDLIKQPPIPYVTLQALEKAAFHHGQLDCGQNVAAPMTWYYAASGDDPTSYYSYVANGRFAIAKTHMEAAGDTADYVWQGYIRDKGVLEVDKQGDFTIEAFKDSPCWWLYPDSKGTDVDTKTNGACGAPDPNRI